jgi:hypothetical protein
MTENPKEIAECIENNCLVAEAVEFYWGERCPDYEANCHTCMAWAQYDKFKNLTNVSEGETA